jgi:RNA polymerase sigma factor (sigma-70 family)
LNEPELIKRCIQKDAAAQKIIYERYANQMFRLCYRYLNQENDAEDIMITAFHKVFENIQRFENRDKDSFQKWIKTIMINEAMMYLRKQKKFEIVTSIETRNLSEDATIESNLNAEDIYRLITKLPLGYRTVFNLYVIDGYTHDEIARQLGISANTSKSQLSRARAILQDQINKLYQQTA